jgi:hypothetical protein
LLLFTFVYNIYGLLLKNSGTSSVYLCPLMTLLVMPKWVHLHLTDLELTRNVVEAQSERPRSQITCTQTVGSFLPVYHEIIYKCQGGEGGRGGGELLVLLIVTFKKL